MILESIGDEMEEGGLHHGIAGKKGFSIITIAKTGMSSEPGSLLKILNVLAKHEVNVEYLPVRHRQRLARRLVRQGVPLALRNAGRAAKRGAAE